MGRQQQVSDLVYKDQVHIICLQETIKVHMTNKVLKNIGGPFPYDWNIKPAIGHSGGLLLGVRTDFFEVLQQDQGDFFVSSIVKEKKDCGLLGDF